MPVYSLKCNLCGNKRRKIINPKDLNKWLDDNLCCDARMVRCPDIKGEIIERIDNGLMPSAVERPNNIKELIHDRVMIHEGKK